MLTKCIKSLREAVQACPRRVLQSEVKAGPTVKVMILTRKAMRGSASHGVRLDHGDSNALRGQSSSTAETGHARADDDHVGVRHLSARYRRAHRARHVCRRMPG